MTKLTTPALALPDTLQLFACFYFNRYGRFGFYDFIE
jgi:hypothetical protein